MYLSLYCKGSKWVTQSFTVRGSCRPNKDCNILTPTLMAVSAVSFSVSRAAQPEPRGLSFLLIAGFLYHILSPTGLRNYWGPHLISQFSGPQLSDFLSSQSYIIVQRPLNRPLNPWNGMFDRHQAEITVMQFKGSLFSGASLCSGAVGPSPCPILSAELTCAISFD